MVDLSLLRESLEVVGSDGGHVGRVDHVHGDQIELAKLDLGSGFTHHLIPVSWVRHVDGHQCFSIQRDLASSRVTLRWTWASTWSIQLTGIM